jgi:hypothetical protein
MHKLWRNIHFTFLLQGVDDLVYVVFSVSVVGRAVELKEPSPLGGFPVPIVPVVRFALAHSSLPASVPAHSS